MSQDRRLAAIMFTDIVGYTALMGSDEDRAFEVLAKNREIHNQLIEKFNGTLIKEMGDGMLISFNLASDAVRCAIEIRKTCKEESIPLKIGIHEGEMVFDGEDVLGDGVNIASRLQQDAEEGSINISSSVYKDIKNKADIHTGFVKEKVFRNVDEPVKVYEVLNEAIESAGGLQGKIIPKKTKKKQSYYLLVIAAIIIIGVILTLYFFPPKPTVEIDKSIAVLPFVNMSNDAEQQYFSDGVMKAILNHLTKIEELKVISSTSVTQYRNTEKTSPQIAEELGVLFLLEGGVQIYGGKVRINAQLIDAVQDQLVWSENYDRELTDILVIQSEVAKEIAGILHAKIDPEVKTRIETPSTDNIEAYNLYLKAMSLLMSERIGLLDEALALDPDYADAYAQKGYAWLVLGGFVGSIGSHEVISNATTNITRALEIDPDNHLAHYVLGALQLWYFWNFEEAEKEFLAALRMNLSSSVIFTYTNLLHATGRFDESLELAKQGLRSDPSSVSMIGVMGLCQYFMDQSVEATKTIEAVLESNPSISAYNDAARVYLYLGRYEAVIATLLRYLELNPEPRFRSSRPLGNLAIAYLKTGQSGRTQELLDEIKGKSQESPTGSPSFYIAMIYAQMGEIDLAFEWLEKAYQNHEVEMYWLKIEPPFEPIRSDPRYQEMLEKIGFP